MFRSTNSIGLGTIPKVAPSICRQSPVVLGRRRCSRANGFTTMPTLRRFAGATHAAIKDGVRDVPDSNILDGPYSGKKAVVVGAGPGGSMAAILLAKRGFDVQVFEKRPNPDCIPMTVHRSIAMSLNPEVSQLLDDVGVQIKQGEYNNGLVFFKDTFLIMPSGDVRKLPPVEESGKRVLTERHAIANAVLKSATTKEMPNLKFIFDSQCEELDISSQIARLSDANGAIKEVRYDLLIGADGVHSKVRQALKDSGHLDFKQRTSKARHVSIRNLPLPVNPSGEGAVSLEVGNVYIVRLKTKMPKKTPRTLMFYKAENDLVQALVLADSDRFDAIKGGEMEWIHKAAPNSIPKEWLNPIAEQMQKNVFSVIGPATYCTSFIGPHVALIGDACHSATPILGTGANRAILDARDLDNALEVSNGEISTALHTYDENCRPKVAAFQDLDFVEGDTAERVLERYAWNV